MNHKNSGLAYGTSGSPQLTFENGDAERLAQDIADNLAMESSDTYTYNHDEVIEAVNKNNIEFLRTKLTQTSPIAIPNTAAIKPEHKKNGYDHVSYKWSDSSYNYESRWHTHTPNAPEYSHDSWVVTRTLPGIPAGKNHRQKEVKYLVKGMGWVSSDDWENAKKLRKQNKETTESRRILDNGHWQVG